MRLIDADKLYRWIKTECNPYGKPTLDYLTGVSILNRIKEMPSVEAVPVVRCKDCVYSKRIQIYDGSYRYDCIIGYRANKGNWYCADGEEKK